MQTFPLLHTDLKIRISLADSSSESISKEF